ncbi:PIN domain-containing protein [Vulcanisaeta distributa]|uniref:type II toxin-antitoxin system VapC family toxin n=1 Tax=Vulcanisaeta distributa TaxID=164451 RepID=UPI0006D2AAC0|nr:PIN domain-containing protein [Vulcanisaeta distributa]
MYLIDANIFLEVIYRRDKWTECYEFLNRVKKGDIRAYALHFTIYAISAILGKPDLISKFLPEMSTWRGLVIIDSPVDEEAMAAELAFKVGLDFDDGLHYYYAKKMGLKLISFDKDFDRTDIERLEPHGVLRTS